MQMLTEVSLNPFQKWHFRQVFRRLLPYFVSTVVIYLLLRQIEIQSIWDLFIQVNKAWVLIGFGWYFLTNICRSYRFGTLLFLPGPFKSLRLIPDMIILSFLNNVLPARAGELLFPVLMRQRHKVPVGQSLALLIVVRIFDFLAVSVLFLVFICLTIKQLTIISQQIVLGVVAVLLPSLLLLASFPWLGERGMTLFCWFLRYFGLAEHRVSQWLIQVGGNVVTAVAQVHSIKTYAKAFFWSLLGWLGTFAWFAAFLQALNLSTAYPFVVVGSTFATISKAIPLVTVGGFGAHEAGWGLGFRLVGMPLETAIASGFAVNMLTLVASITLTGFTSIWLAKKGRVNAPSGF